MMHSCTVRAVYIDILKIARLKTGWAGDNLDAANQSPILRDVVTRLEMRLGQSGPLCIPRTTTRTSALQVFRSPPLIADLTLIYLTSALLCDRER